MPVFRAVVVEPRGIELLCQNFEEKFQTAERLFYAASQRLLFVFNALNLHLEIQMWVIKWVTNQPRLA